MSESLRDYPLGLKFTNTSFTCLSILLVLFNVAYIVSGYFQEMDSSISSQSDFNSSFQSFTKYFVTSYDLQQYEHIMHFVRGLRKLNKSNFATISFVVFNSLVSRSRLSTVGRSRIRFYYSSDESLLLEVSNLFVADDNSVVYLPINKRIASNFNFVVKAEENRNNTLNRVRKRKIKFKIRNNYNLLLTKYK